MAEHRDGSQESIDPMPRDLRLVCEEKGIKIDDYTKLAEWAFTDPEKDSIEWLLKRRVDINLEGQRGRTALQAAALRQDETLVKWLLDQPHIDVSHQDSREKRTALSWACQGGSKAIVRDLLKNEGIAAETINLKDLQGRTALSFAAEHGRGEAVTVLLGRQDVDVNSADNNRCTPLRWAVKGDSEEVAKLLLRSDKVHRRSSDSQAARNFIVYRTIIICFDGTWNDREIKQPFTNVTRLQGYLANKSPRTSGDLRASRSSRREQFSYYIDGIGTGTTWLGSVREAVQAAGIHRKIREAYRNVCFTYFDEEDWIVLMGFSRGAFTALCLAKFINDVGLLHGSWVNKELLPIYELWAASDSTSKDKLERRCTELSTEGKLRRGIKIEAFAAWDTVNSSKHLNFVGDKLPPNIRHVYHALALDERRRDFSPMVLEPTGHVEEFRQCWFLGSHSDVGGGNHNSGLANIPLYWMMTNLDAARIVGFRDNIFSAVPSEGSILRYNTTQLGDLNTRLQWYDSYRRYWRYWSPKHRVVGRKKYYETIHATVNLLLEEIASSRGKLFESQPLVGFKITEDGWAWTNPDNSLRISVERFPANEMLAFNGWILLDLTREFREGEHKNLWSDTISMNQNGQ
ncbi:MAG: hypothetical protein M1823_000493 [Watsoniomyces obsoletus]|nr:MAG: hypothetical protein M1823_000493 [Watsoniomyces obsoletus]